MKFRTVVENVEHNALEINDNNNNTVMLQEQCQTNKYVPIIHKCRHDRIINCVLISFHRKTRLPYLETTVLVSKAEQFTPVIHTMVKTPGNTCTLS